MNSAVILKAVAAPILSGKSSFVTLADLDIAESIDDTARYFTLWKQAIAVDVRPCFLGNG